MPVDRPAGLDTGLLSPAQAESCHSGCPTRRLDEASLRVLKDHSRLVGPQPNSARGEKVLYRGEEVFEGKVQGGRPVPGV